MKMLSRKTVSTVAIAWLLSSVATSAQQIVPPPIVNRVPHAANYTVVPGIPYADPQGTPLLADIYLPKGQGSFPGIVFLHGGGWHNGDRTQLRRQARYMAEHGMVGMAIDYRLAPAHPFPAALNDAKEAVIWLRSHAAEYHVDSGKIAAVGSSAGAYLAAMLGVQSDLAQPGRRTNVQAVVAFNGIFDLEAMPPGTMVSDFLGKPCADAPTLCHQASPTDQISSRGPAYLILHGTADEMAPFAQANDFVEKLKNSNAHVELFTAEGAPHTFWAEPLWREPSFEAMANFLQKVFRTTGSQPSMESRRLPSANTAGQH